VVDLDRERARACIPLGPQPADDLVARGEALFHDARLSHESWMSCHSCHPDGHTTGRRNDNLGDGSFGAPKRILSLRGAADTLPLGWNGAVATLEEQVRASLDSTLLGGRGDDDDSTVRAIAAYLRTLPPAPPPSAFARPEAARDAAVARGRALFGELGCRRCHVPPRYTSPGVYDVGLEDEAGNRRFHPPSLRGVAQRDAYFHDNRARSLAQVFSVGSHHVGDELPAADLAALVAFLESL
jgi:cytochrome c peroxidase